MSILLKNSTESEMYALAVKKGWQQPPLFFQFTLRGCRLHIDCRQDVWLVLRIRLVGSRA